MIRDESEVSASWLGQILGQGVDHVRIASGHGTWSRQLMIDARLSDGTTRALRLKICLGDTFGRSEVDYYTRDYVDLPDAPLVPCFDAQYDPAVGYHILLADLAATHQDHRDVAPSLAHGVAVARALGRLHKHHWESMPAPDEAAVDRYLDEIRPGLAPLESATGHALRDRFARHEEAFRRRWARPQGMSLLHGDLNPTNLLTPRSGETPVHFLDRQPFDWSMTYGLAVSDLAHFMIPWWPEQTRQECELTVLRQWHEALDEPGYRWTDALSDWRLSVEQCLDVPLEWCSKPATLESMRWLWGAQFARVQDALARPGTVLVAPLRTEDHRAARQLLVDGLAERWGAYDAGFNPDIESFPPGDRNASVLVARVLDQVVGTGTLVVIAPGRAEIVRMSVAKAHRRSGIGSLLLSHLLSLAREQGIREVVLETTTTWESAVRFYERHGFQRTHEQDGNTYFRYAQAATRGADAEL